MNQILMTVQTVAAKDHRTSNLSGRPRFDILFTLHEANQATSSLKSM